MAKVNAIVHALGVGGYFWPPAADAPGIGLAHSRQIDEYGSELLLTFLGMLTNYVHSQ